MKKRIEKLLCYSFLAFISTSINFDVEARLPKYMAQRAAELLIEKSGLVLKDENEENRKQKRMEFAAELVDLLYSTSKRQKLANWFRLAYHEDIKVSTASGDIQNIIKKVNGVAAATIFSRDLVNRHFPCWTGTLTCFVLNGEAHQLLAQGNAVDSCRTKLSSAESTRKIVGILFVLELIDNWNDIKQICKTEEDDDVDRLKEPDYVALDPYDCVPVPNTAYEYEGIFKGTCLLSTIRNLLSILGGPYQDFISFNIKHEVKGYLRGHHLANIPGITNINEQNRWAGTLLAIRDLHLPDLKGFVDTLIGLLDTKNENILQLYDQAKLQQYRDGFNSRTKTQNGNIKQDILDPLITQILKSITNHDISANIRTANQSEKTTRTWPVLILEISDDSIHKKITVGIGHVGGGQHIEILNIELI